MSEETSATKRRVYDLPTELVERIVEFQKDRSLPSEVEAARRLLDQALKNRDTLEQVVGRYLAALSPGVEPGEAAGVVLSGHPSVKSINFIEDGIRFEFQPPNKDVNEVTIIDATQIKIDFNVSGGYSASEVPYIYDEKAPVHKRLKQKPEPQRGAVRNVDDEIPF